jgi:hypothetical protein
MFSLAGALSSIPYVLATVGLMLAYNGLIDNPMVRREARQGYVQESRITALQAANDELKRQAKVSEDLATAWQKSLERFQTQAEANQTVLEEKVRAYENDPANANRCTITDADGKFLQDN